MAAARSKRSRDQARAPPDPPELVEQRLEYLLALTMCCADVHEDQLRDKTHGTLVAMTSTFTPAEVVLRKVQEKLDAQDRRTKTFKPSLAGALADDLPLL